MEVSSRDMCNGGCNVGRQQTFTGRWREHAKPRLSLRATQREELELTVRDRVHGGVLGGPRGKDPGKNDSMRTIWPRPQCGQSRNDTPVRRW